MRRWLIAGLSAGALLFFGCLEDPVEFGPPGNLRVRGVASQDACPLPEGTDPSSCPEWSTVIFPLFDQTYGCADDGCHLGPNDPTGVNLVQGDADASYDALASFVREGRPYVSDNPGDNPYLLCNIDPNSAIRVGTLMPIGQIISPEDLALIGAWVACGMQKEGGTPGTGGGGGAGGGGTGGAGGN